MPVIEELANLDAAGVDPVDEFLNLERWPLSPVNHDDDGDYSYSQPQSQSSSADMFMVGFVMVNVVGLRHYSGTINGREMVGLVREPLNPYDENAIKVLNTRSIQVGHIEASAARVLAPLIDSRLITIEGIVPKPPGGTNRNRIKLPCQIHIFARLAAFEEVKSALETGDLQLHSDNSPLSEAAVVRQKRSNQDEKSLDEVFKLLDEKIAEKGKLDELEPPKDVIKSELLSHQKEGLGWLVYKENSLGLPPFWEEKDGEYVNVLTNYMTHQRPEPLRGGIFADDMGLGKTLTLLSLIAFDKFCGDSPSIEADVDIEKNLIIDQKGKKLKRERGNQKADKPQKRPKTEDANVARMKGKSISSVDRPASLVSRATLIVCPPSVFSAWLTQLEEHTVRGRLKTYLYHGERTNDAHELKMYDIVLTTYSTLANEDPWLESPIKMIEWRRIILDEAHVIKNVNALQSRAVTKLNAKRRWVVTGTPIQNHSFDLFSLMAFLRFEPLSIKSYWNSLIARPLSLGDEKGISRLQVLMASISLRRTKDKALVGLPSKTVETYFIDLSEEERDVYDKMEADAKKIIRQFISSGNVIRNYSSVLSILVRIRQVCNDLSLCPPDIKELLPTLEDVNNNPKLLEKMLSVLQEDEEFDCPICICPPTNAVITSCTHIFCRACILKSIRQSKACCPLCRHPLSDSDLFVSPPKLSEADNIGASSSSSKVNGLLKLLSASRHQNPTSKSVIFSQFRKMLLLLEEPLKAAGFKVLRLDGSMNAKRRPQLIKEFGVPAPDGPTILLASLKACGAGINLTAASTVYLLEPWWNPAIEEQAMDRVHRIGQKEDVKIVRMIARNTIEERILELQENKKLLAKKAFGRRGAGDQREIGQEDLITLMKL